MFREIFGIVTSGLSTGGAGILSSIGRFVGKNLGAYLDHLSHVPDEHCTFKNIKDNFAFTTAKYGDSIPLIFGTIKVHGKIIWSSQVQTKSKTDIQKRYFPNPLCFLPKQTKSMHKTIEYKYYLSFAIAICEGEISEIKKIWANNELISFNNSNYQFRLYYGAEDQMPDPLIAANCLENQAPAMRDLAYIVFEDLPLADFDNTVPQFSFEVLRKSNTIYQSEDVANLVQSMIMIPGSGEFVYDTIVQYKSILHQNGVEMYKEAINAHNHLNIPNSIHSLNQLQTTCPNVNWIAPVACWFGDHLDANNCRIRPAVEFNDPNTQYSEEWRVGNYHRYNAKLISKDSDGNPKYGGSINDVSLIRYLEEVRAKGINIMFYPMFLMDLPDKPWRGHVTTRPDSVKGFFTKRQGYNEFIIHYANLVKNHVDAFVIGSELIGLTKVMDRLNQFPAVIELINLAQVVKRIVGPNVLVTYAADWSEYHHTGDGWYNLDDLWASDAIDFIGIDAYFPATRTTNSNISEEEIIQGFSSGDGIDYRVDTLGNKHPLKPEYAWKNIKFWWENYHCNPDGKFTKWQPRMKKIWFTEFGFPSIDKAPNQPNVFFDPNCSDGGTPLYSSGETDFSIQRRSIKAFIKHWRQEEYIGNMFLWTWDARPYPAWPHMNIWKDGNLWEKGHWVNEKFGAVTLESVLYELSNRCGIDVENVMLSSIDDVIDGMVFNNANSVIDIINTLRIVYFFDILADYRICFIKRGCSSVYKISTKNLVQIAQNTYLHQYIIAKEEIINAIHVYYIDHIKDYNIEHCYVTSENQCHKNNMYIKLPIALSYPEIERLGYLILRNAFIEDKIIKFMLPAYPFAYSPSDFISIKYLNQELYIRVVSIKLDDLIIEITGIIDDRSMYYLPNAKTQQSVEYQCEKEIAFIALDLPCLLDSANSNSYVALYMNGNSKKSLYFSTSLALEHTEKIADITPKSIIGKVLSFNSTETQIDDTTSEFVVLCNNFENYQFEQWNLAIIGTEIMYFQNWSQVADNQYRINRLMRGQFNTDIYLHYPNEQFIILSSYSSLLQVSQSLENKSIFFKISDISNEMLFQNKSQQLLAPIIEHYEIDETYICITLKRASRYYNYINEAITIRSDDKCSFEIQITGSNISHNIITNENVVYIDHTQLNLQGEVIISIASIYTHNKPSTPVQITCDF